MVSPISRGDDEDDEDDDEEEEEEPKKDEDDDDGEEAPIWTAHRVSTRDLGAIQHKGDDACDCRSERRGRI